MNKWDRVEKKTRRQSLNEVLVREWTHRILIVLFGATVIYFTWF